jgi:membrane protein
MIKGENNVEGQHIVAIIKNFLKKIYDMIWWFVDEIFEHNVGVYAAQSSFFLILSIFPLAMVLLAIIGMTNLPQDVLSNAGLEMLPSSVEPFFQELLEEMTVRSSGTLLSMSALAAAWSSSKGILSIQRGLQAVHDKRDTRNYLIQRFISLFYTLILIVIVILMLTVLVFGNQLYLFVINKIPVASRVLGILFSNRAVFFLCILTLFFLMLYATTKAPGYTLGDLMPGAFFSASGWMLFSYIFSLYVDGSNSLSYMYGSLTTVIVSMLWLYFCMYIVFIGGEFNVFIKTKAYRTYKKF